MTDLQHRGRRPPPGAPWKIRGEAPFTRRPSAPRTRAPRLSVP
ncbi:MAG: hypothetical protein OXU61_09710 [Gammaproteobacteria bacterium]|nr:hypothetical protein [Gammaproteobacteria bacterium]